MKTKFLFYLIIFCNLGIAQNPDLFDTEWWYLEKYIINGTDVPQTNESNYFHSIKIEENNGETTIHSYYCQILYDFYCSSITDSAFTYNDFIGYFVDCDNYNEYDDTNLVTNSNFYFTNNNTFNYVVNSGANGAQQLIITNTNGDSAIYNNANLSTIKIGLDNTSIVYPNPLEDVLNIKTKIDIDNINLYGIDGKWIQTFENNSENKIDVSNLKSGIYLIEVISDDKIVKHKIIKK